MSGLCATYSAYFGYVFGTHYTVVFGGFCTFIDIGIVTTPQHMLNTQLLKSLQLRDGCTVSTFF
jgi:hypothetical protein